MAIKNKGKSKVSVTRHKRHGKKKGSFMVKHFRRTFPGGAIARRIGMKKEASNSRTLTAPMTPPKKGRRRRRNELDMLLQ